MHLIYDKLSRIGFLSRSYTFKFMFIAVVGIYVPLIGLIMYILIATGEVSTGNILLIALLLTVGLTAATFVVLNSMLAPLKKSQQSLHNYLHKHQLPELPVHYSDEAGQLMQHVQLTLTELNNVLEEKKDLTALLSHDLRIPLCNVKTYAGILREQSLSAEEIRELATSIQDSATEQQQILETILEILRLDYLFQQGQHMAPMPLEALVQDSINTMMPMAHNKQIRLTADFAYSGLANIHPELFAQVLKNLLSNAIKFSNKGAHVLLRVYRTHDKTFIDVTDEGIGFDPRTAEQLFERFTRSGRPGTSGEPSTGLGLYLSRKIIRHQHGEITALSDGCHKGATFRISLT